MCAYLCYTKQNNMTHTITVTGQIAGNQILASAIARQCLHTEDRKLPFNGVAYDFANVKDARKALWLAYRNMSNNDLAPRYSAKSAIYYDASKAELI